MAVSEEDVVPLDRPLTHGEGEEPGTGVREAVAEEMKEHEPVRYALYMIHSEQHLSDLRTYLESLTVSPGGSDVGIMRIDHRRDPKGVYSETNRTLACLHPRVYSKFLDKLGEAGTSARDSGMSISPYEIRSGNHPPKDCGYALYLRLPLDVLTFAMCQKQLLEKLEKLHHAHILNASDYTVHYPTATRESKILEHKGFTIIKFKPSLDRDTCAMVKVILDQTKWWDSKDKGHICRVSWCKKSALNELGRGHASLSHGKSAGAGKSRS